MTPIVKPSLKSARCVRSFSAFMTDGLTDSVHIGNNSQHLVHSMQLNNSEVD